MKDLIKEKVQAYMPEIVKNLTDLVSYPSVYSEDAKPFGQANIDCLNHALKIGEDYGFTAVNVDNYAGYIEIGEGEEVIGVVGHLDVVPVSDTWNTDPFKVTVIDDKLYGRGTSDDKGGVICSLTAMKILSEIKPKLNKRIRLIMGCNEESGSAGLRYYIQKHGYVDCGYTPDGWFPVVFGEKGTAGGLLKINSEIITNASGGTAPNAVIAKVTFNIDPSTFDEKKYAEYLKENGLTYTYEDTKMTVYGTAAHASTPEMGINAWSHAIEALYVAGAKDNYIETYHSLIGTGYNGEGLGVDLSDEYGRLTLNIGLIKQEGETITATIDSRFPVTMTHQPICDLLTTNGKGYVVNVHGSDPLFFPLDSPMIKALLDAYYSFGDSNLKPVTIGGGTYAKTMHNIVAFGCDTGEYNWHIHDDNEFTTLNSLQTQTEIYVQALLNLLEI